MSVSNSTHVTFTLNDNSPSDANSDHGTLEAPGYRTRTTYNLNKEKIVKSLVNDAFKDDFETIFNNFNENVNIKCSSGFFLEVAGPALIDLAKQSLNKIPIKNCFIQCTNTRTSLDIFDLHVNSIFFFNISNVDKSIIGSVTIHNKQQSFYSYKDLS